MDAKQFNEVIARMDLIIRLLAINIVKDMKTQADRILYLSSLGFRPKDIAGLLGTSQNTVNVALSKARKKIKTVQETEKSVEQETVEGESA